MGERLVRDIMVTDVPAVAPEDSVQRVVEVLREHEVPGVPVINDGGRCVGIITEADLVLSDDDGDLHIPHSIELLGGVVFLEPLRRFEQRLRRAHAMTAGELMTEDPDTIGPEATVREAAKEIARKRHNRLPVTEHGRLLGVVTRIGVLEALALDDEE